MYLELTSYVAHNSDIYRHGRKYYRTNSELTCFIYFGGDNFSERSLFRFSISKESKNYNIYKII